MLSEATLLSYVQGDHWKVGKSRTSFQFNVRPASGQGWEKLVVPTTAAVNEEAGIYFRWFAHEDDSELHKFKGREYNIGGKCPNEPHVHLEVRVRTQAGGMTTSGGRNLFIPENLTKIQSMRGAPKNRKKITKSNLPEPFKFNQDDYVRGQWGGWTRISALSSCGIVGPVGISDNAKAEPDLALKPDEDVWFHFDCTSPTGATFDIITDGDVWYPLNRRSKRITTNLKPKSSLDLTQLGVLDQELILKAIEHYASEVTNA